MMTDNGIVDGKGLKRLLAHMIDIYSPSGKEQEILEYLYAYLKGKNLPVQKERIFL